MSVVILSVFMFLSCASTDTAKLEWPYGARFEYKENAIKLKVNADKNLNIYEGEAKTLHLCVYQLRSPNIINKMTSNEDGLYQLLEKKCGFSDGSVASSMALTVQPGESVSYTFDRAEGAKYIAFVAGYYSLQKERIVRIVRVPVVFVKKSTGIFSSVEVPTPANLNIRLSLGPKQILKIESNQNE